MSDQPTPPSPAVQRLGRKHTEYRLTGLTNRLAATFTTWQSTYIRRLVKWSQEERFALGVLLTMAICEKADLLGIATSGAIYQTSDGPTLEWMRPDGRRGARSLSHMVALSLDASFDPRCDGKFVETLDAALKKVDAALAASDDPVTGALSCSEAWCFLALPQFLFAHVCGDLPMTALPRSAFARLESGDALSSHIQSGFVDDEDSTQALDAFFHSSAQDNDGAVMKDIVDSTRLRDVANKSDQQLRDDLAATWRGKIDDAEKAGPLTSLQLASALHLAARGSLKPSTLVAYIKDGIPVIHDALATLELTQLSSEQLSQRLADSLDKVSGQKRANAKAFLGHLWRYARQWTDVEPLLPSMLPDVDAGTVDANIIWPHEGDRMDVWLSGPQRDDDLARQTRLARRLMGATNARASEIFFLQIRNIHIYDGQNYIDVELIFRGRRHGLKSKDSQRTVRVDGALAAELVGHVNRRRIEQGGLGAHLLFGTKTQPNRVYRLAAMYNWLNSAAKQATGDPTSCCHHFRHAAIDSRFAAMTPDDIEAGAREQLRVDAGHASLQSTQRSYMHRFAGLLKSAVAEALTLQHSLSSSTTSAWTGERADNLRQLLARERKRSDCHGSLATRPELESSSAWCWHSLQQASLHRHLAPAAEAFSFCCPLPPRALAAPRPWSVLDMIAFLNDIHHGDTPQQAGRQRRLAEVVSQAAVDELLELGQKRLSDSARPLDIMLSTPAAALEALEIRTGAAYQPKYLTWLIKLSKSSPPELSDSIWAAWDRSTRGHYIKVNVAHRSDRWLAFVVEQGLAASKLRVCIATGNPALEADIRRLVRTAMSQTAAGGTVMYESCSYNDRRGRCYVLVGDEGDVLTDSTGAAFSTAGMRAIVLAMRLAAVAMSSMKKEEK